LKNARYIDTKAEIGDECLAGKPEKDSFVYAFLSSADVEEGWSVWRDLSDVAPPSRPK
jgi:hypothetical protein